MKVLFISPMNVSVANGMLRRQEQFLHFMERNGVDVDFLSAISGCVDVSKWANQNSLKISFWGGLYGFYVRSIYFLWRAINEVLCNKICLYEDFKTPYCIYFPRIFAKKYDLIVCYYPWMYCLLGLSRFGEKVLVDLGDVMSNRHKRIGVKTWISLALDDERAIINSSKAYAISEDDSVEFERLYEKKINVLPFMPQGINDSLIMEMPAKRKSIGFLAAKSMHNLEIVDLIAQGEFSDLLNKYNCNFHLAGSICASLANEKLKAIQKYGLNILGRVDKVEDFYKNVSIIFNPIGPSTGVKIKSVEALLFGRILITTRFGVDASLLRIFGSQIILIEWPINSFKIIERVIDEALKRLEAIDLEIVEVARMEYKKYVNECFENALKK